MTLIVTVAAAPETFTIEHSIRLPPDWVIGGDAIFAARAGVAAPIPRKGPDTAGEIGRGRPGGLSRGDRYPVRRGGPPCP
jgi:hypothetical protein